MATEPAKTATITTTIDRISLRVTIASTVVAVIAAIAGVWTGYEAHQTRIEDERPFIAVDFTPDPTTAQMDLIDQLHFFDTHLVSTGRTPARKVQFTCGMIPTSSGGRLLNGRFKGWTHDSLRRFPTYSPVTVNRSLVSRFPILHIRYRMRVSRVSLDSVRLTIKIYTATISARHSV